MKKDEMTTEQQIKHMQDTLYVINGKWKLPVLVAIHQGASRFREIQRSVNGITTKVLSKELKDLEQNKLVVRRVMTHLRQPSNTRPLHIAIRYRK